MKALLVAISIALLMTGRGGAQSQPAITNKLFNGCGVWVLYDENGIEENRRYYLDGKKGSLHFVFPQPAAPSENEPKSENRRKQGEEDALFEDKFRIASPI